MYYLPTTIIFFIFAVLTIGYTIKNRKKKREEHNFTNEILIGMLFLLSGILFPFMYQSHSNISQDTLNFLWFSTSIILVVELSIWCSIILKNAYKVKSRPDELFDYEGFCKQFKANYKYDFKKDVERKFLHLLPVFVIFFFWTLGAILDAFGVLALWGLDNYSFALWLIITVGFGFVVMFQFADLIRLNIPHTLPGWAQDWYKKSMTVDELDSFISSAPLVLSFVPFIFAPFPIFGAVALITAGADAAASLVGKRYGKRKFRESSKKTIEGYIAGGTMTFLIVVLTLGIYNELMTVGVVIIMTMALVASILFFFVDALLSENITDNILNPFLTGLGMWVIVLL